MRSGRWSILVFASGAIAVLAMLAWVTAHTLRLERQEREARALAKHQESIRLALWRMDAAVTPIIAREAARPYFEYRSFYPADKPVSSLSSSAGEGEVFLASPLLQDAGAYVMLHFQRDADGTLSSPQAPTGPWRQFAEPAYLSAYALQSNEALVRQIQPLFANPSEPQYRGLASGGAPDAPAGRTEPAPAAQSLEETPRPQSAQISAMQAEDPQSTKEFEARQKYADSARNISQAPRNRKGEGQTHQAAGEQTDREVAKDAKTESARDASGVAAPASSITPAASAPPPPAPVEKVASGAGPADRPPAEGAERRADEPARTEAAAPPGSPGPQPETGALDKKSRVELQPEVDKSVAWHEPASKVLSYTASAAPEVSQGPFVARWLSRTGESPKLVFEREVTLGSEHTVQGFWLDWDSLRQSLLGTAGDLFPVADLRPLLQGVDGAEAGVLGRTLAAIPAEFVVPPPQLPPSPMITPVRTTLFFTWLTALVAIVAIAMVLRASMDLAERRGQFVSAVTHELRTPLTTFVMYSQMLADGMIKDETARATYLSTLKAESQRLARIVESVLDYARLSKRRGASVRTRVSADALLESVRPALEQRCTQGGMTLVVDREGDLSVPVETDPATIERILFNLVDNACKYAAGAADRRVHLAVQASGRDVTISVRDHGPGVEPQEAASVFRPFTRGKRQSDGSIPGLGLGLALSQNLARQIGGDLRLISGVAGAEFRVRMPRA